jgi:D-serine deaminase-like pyridoxal phosphate-dependent protein
LSNIRRMATKAARLGLRLRPHFKTHQSALVADWFRAHGVHCATVSSLDMAAYFADHGWHDLTVAFPCNLRQHNLINHLAARIQLGLLADAPEVVAALQATLHHPVQVWVEVDAGYGRTGVPWNDSAALVALAQQIAQGAHTRLAGLLTHAGHSYAARGAAAVRAVAGTALQRMAVAQASLLPAGLPRLPISFGDTPSCSVLSAFPAVDELRPGNFVFYDLTQLQIGACGEDDLALALLCPVVARYPERGRLVVHGGAVHLSKDMLRAADGSLVFGQVAHLGQGQWGPLIPGAHVVSLSQEHGTIEAPPQLLAHTAVGDVLAIVPVHACLAAASMRGYHALTGETIAMFTPPHE